MPGWSSPGSIASGATPIAGSCGDSFRSPSGEIQGARSRVRGSGDSPFNPSRARVAPRHARSRQGMRPRSVPRVRFSGARNRWGPPAVCPRFACRTRWCSADRPGPRYALSPARGAGTNFPDCEAPGPLFASSPSASKPSFFQIRSGVLRPERRSVSGGRDPARRESLAIPRGGARTAGRGETFTTAPAHRSLPRFRHSVLSVFAPLHSDIPVSL